MRGEAGQDDGRRSNFSALAHMSVKETEQGGRSVRIEESTRGGGSPEGTSSSIEDTETMSSIDLDRIDLGD